MNNTFQLDFSHAITPLQTSSAPGSAGGSILSIAPFLTLSRDLAALLVPMRPQPAFRAELHRSLVISAHRLQAQQRLALTAPAAEPPPLPALPIPDWVNDWIGAPDPEQYRWVVRAAAVGSAVSLVGAMAYLWRHRGRPAASA